MVFWTASCQILMKYNEVPVAGNDWVPYSLGSFRHRENLRPKGRVWESELSSNHQFFGGKCQHFGSVGVSYLEPFEEVGIPQIWSIILFETCSTKTQSQQSKQSLDCLVLFLNNWIPSKFRQQLRSDPLISLDMDIYGSYSLISPFSRYRWRPFARDSTSSISPNLPLLLRRT